MPQKPQPEKSESAEEGVESNKLANDTERFKDLARRLLRINREEINDKNQQDKEEFHSSMDL